MKGVDDIVGQEGVGILIANAGATWGEAFETHPDSAFAKVMDLNVRSVFSLIRLSVSQPKLIARANVFLG